GRGGGNLGLADVPVDMGAGAVAPRLVASWARFELRRVDAVRGSDLQAGDEVARSVVGGEHHAGLMSAARLLCPLLVTEHEEAGVVEGQVLDMLGRDLQAVSLGCPAAGDGAALACRQTAGGVAGVPGAAGRGRVGVAALVQQLGGPGGVEIGDGLEAVLADEALTLLQRLCVAVDPLDVLQARAWQYQEVVVHPRYPLGHDRQYRIGEQVVGLVDGAGQAVLYGQASEVTLAADGGVEGLFEAREADGLAVRGEGHGRLFTERACHTLERDAGRPALDHGGESTAPCHAADRSLGPR